MLITNFVVPKVICRRYERLYNARIYHNRERNHSFCGCWIQEQCDVEVELVVSNALVIYRYHIELELSWGVQWDLCVSEILKQVLGLVRYDPQVCICLTGYVVHSWTTFVVAVS